MKKEEKFYRVLKDAMFKNRMSQTELSKRTGICKSTISNYVNGLSEPDPTRKKAILAVFGIELEEPKGKTINKRKCESEISPSEAAKYLCKSNMFVYKGLQDQRFPWGYAVQMPSGQWSYWISRKRFFEETGIKEKIPDQTLDQDQSKESSEISI